jgi:hypothetical protein
LWPPGVSEFGRGGFKSGHSTLVPGEDGLANQGLRRWSGGSM